MHKYPYYHTIQVSPNAQAYIAEQCDKLDLHPMLVYAYAQIVYDQPTEILGWRCTDFVAERARLLATQYNDVKATCNPVDRLRDALIETDTSDDKFADRVLSLQHSLIRREVRQLLDNVKDLCDYDATLHKEGL